MTIIKCFLLANMLLWFLGASYSYARPTITSVSGNLTNKSLVVINGVDFKQKQTASPFRYSNFDNGITGNRLASFKDGGFNTNSVNYPIYSTDKVRYPDAKSIRQQYGPYPGYSVAYEGSPIELNTSKNSSLPNGLQEIYVSGWFNFEVGGAPSRNVKFINMGSSPDYIGWQTRLDTYPSDRNYPDSLFSQGTGHLYANLGGVCFDNGSGQYANDNHATVSTALKPDGLWHRVETYFRIGHNGYRDFWIDGVKVGEISGDFTSDDCQISYVLIGHYFAIDTGDPQPWGMRFWDELYVDTTRARVEIGDAPVWENCTRREIQIPFTWNVDGTTIEINVNQGAMNTLTDKYLFIVDADGNVSDGFSLSGQEQQKPGKVQDFKSQ